MNVRVHNQEITNARPGVSTAGGPHSADTPECPPVAGAAEGCHYHGIFPNHPLEACSGSGGARRDSGGADLCKRGEGPPFTAPPSSQTQPSASQISSPATPGTAVHWHCCPYGPAGGHCGS
ncbi:hypothetical protein MRX96_022024 [Rhipicephalus microplus]